MTDLREQADMPEGSKLCSRCGEIKPYGDFRRHSKARDGYERMCMSCRDPKGQLTTAEKRRRHAEKMRRWRQENPEGARAVDRRKRQSLREDPERLDRHRKRRASWRRTRYPERREHEIRIGRNSMLRTKYGLEPEDYDLLMEAQGGVCAICGKTPRAGGRYRNLAVDHCHETGKVRGLLCDNCNRAIGLLGDCPERVARALAYLRLSQMPLAPVP